MPNRDYDVVLYGASGFTGKQAVRYLAKQTRPGEVRWAIAGRNREKLEAVKTQIGGVAKDADVLVADSHEQAAIDALVARTRVLATDSFVSGSGPLPGPCIRRNGDVEFHGAQEFSIRIEHLDSEVAAIRDVDVPGVI